MSINESSMWAAVHRMESASEQMARAAEEITQAVQRFAFLLEPGYGGNGLRLIELLEQTATQPGQDVRPLVEALEWYEQQASGCRKLTSEGDKCRQALDSDGGKRAQTALAAHRQDT